jgi:Acyltransferase family
VDGPSELFQRPIFRLIVQGQAWVAIFFILMGFVNPLKALRQARDADIEGALMTVAKNALGRAAKLVLPAAAVTAIAWLFCQLGFFEIARQSDAFWLRETSPPPSSTWNVALQDLFQAIFDTWVRGVNVYDQPQWTLLWLLQGSMAVFIVLLATITVTPKARVAILLFYYWYCWIRGNCKPIQLFLSC